MHSPKGAPHTPTKPENKPAIEDFRSVEPVQNPHRILQKIVDLTKPYTSFEVVHISTLKIKTP